VPNLGAWSSRYSACAWRRGVSRSSISRNAFLPPRVSVWRGLVRWHHPVHGKVAPPFHHRGGRNRPDRAARGMGLTPRLQRCRHLDGAHLSPAQFRDANVAETVAHMLSERPLPAERLELEITESLLINNTGEVFDKLNRPCELGVKIVMDDFGTAIRASAISHVSPSTRSRLTGSSCAQHGTPPGDRPIVKIIALSKSLDATVSGGHRVGRACRDAARVRSPRRRRVPLRPAWFARRREQGPCEGDGDHAEKQRDPFAVTAGSWTISLWRSRHWPWAPSAPLRTATRGLGPWAFAALS
jgi:hypothetical protein